MKTVVTHISPDLDAIAAVWLIKRFLPGWHKAEVEFVPAGLTFDKQPADENPNIIHVDTGLGKFDHHIGNKDTCAAKKVFLFLKQKGFIKKKLIEPLHRMIKIINDIDHFREVFLPNPDSDIYDFFIVGILDGLRMKFQNDLQLLETAEIILDGILKTFSNKVQAEEEIRKGLTFPTKWGRTIAIETDNEESSRLAQKKGYSLVIRKSPKKGHLRIKLLPGRDKDNLSILYNLLKQKDPGATWYFHPSGKMILNGTAKNPNTIPTKLTLNEVTRIVKKVL